MFGVYRLDPDGVQVLVAARPTEKAAQEERFVQAVFLVALRRPAVRLAVEFQINIQGTLRAAVAPAYREEIERVFTNELAVTPLG